MKTKNQARPFILPLVASLAAVSFTGCTQPVVYQRSPPVVVVERGPYAPPPAIVEYRPAPPPYRVIWVQGHWRWNGSRYVWVPGHYRPV
ncbi:MAG TPA: YXWGXW repeat-containing protein [Chthoniobacterales bacterium]